jgi:radical SAM protein with 4Fe4S-binding SPASM domain
MDPLGNVYPCSMYDRRLGNIRETEYAIRPIWDAEESKKVQREIWNYQCPQCWTPCEAYQSIFGNFFTG